MDDFYDDDCEDYYNDPDSLVSVMPQDDHVEYQRIQEELYQEAYDAEFDRIANSQNIFLNSSNRESFAPNETSTSCATANKKRKRGNKNEKTPQSIKRHKHHNKQPSKDVSIEASCINQISDVIPSSGSKNAKINKNQSFKEMVEDSGLTMNDLKTFIDEENTKDGLASDASSEYIVVSESCDSSSEEESDSEESDNENIDVNIASRSLSKDDITLSRILDSLPDDSSWNISTSDIVGQSSNSAPRFHNLMKKVRCANCNERGHHTYLCPKPKKLSKCILCGEAGHLFRNCPFQLCFKCDQPGHSARECEERVASYHDRCKRCSCRGHYEERCPDTWRQYHLTISDGNILRASRWTKKGNEKRDKIRSCYNCGDTGHFGHACQVSRMDKFQSVCTPYIFKYDANNEQDDKEHKSHRDRSRRDLDKKSDRKLEIDKKARSLVNNVLESNADDDDCIITRVVNNSSKSTKSQKSESNSFQRRETSQKKRDRVDCDVASSTFDKNDSLGRNPQSVKPASILPLMDLSFSGFNQACTSTPLNLNSRNKTPKLIEPSEFPRHASDYVGSTPSNSKQKNKIFKFLSPISPPRSFDLDESPERQIDSCMANQSELQNSYYGNKQMKKARRKQAKKEKKTMLKMQMQEAKDNNPKLAKQWWSVQKSQQQDFFREMNSASNRRKTSNNNNSQNSSGTKTPRKQGKNNSQRHSGQKRKRKGANVEGHNNNLIPRGFKLGTFQ